MYVSERIAPIRRKLIPNEGGAKWGFIDNTGRIIIPAQFDKVHPFGAGGFAPFNLGGHVEIEDIHITHYTLPYSEADPYYQDFELHDTFHQKRFCGGQWGIINTQGKIVIPAVYDSISIFCLGKAAIIKKGNKNRGDFVPSIALPLGLEPRTL